MRPTLDCQEDRGPPINAFVCRKRSSSVRRPYWARLAMPSRRLPRLGTSKRSRSRPADECRNGGANVAFRRPTSMGGRLRRPRLRLFRPSAGRVLVALKGGGGDQITTEAARLNYRYQQPGPGVFLVDSIHADSAGGSHLFDEESRREALMSPNGQHQGSDRTWKRPFS